MFGPESHMTAIVGMALGTRPIEEASASSNGPSLQPTPASSGSAYTAAAAAAAAAADTADTAADEGIADALDFQPLFTKSTRALFFGMQPRAVQGMLDFDYCCGRERPSVAGMIYPFSGNHSQKFYWGTKEVMVPVYQHMEEAMRVNPDVDVLINFASFRSAYDSSMETLNYPQIRE